MRRDDAWRCVAQSDATAPVGMAASSRIPPAHKAASAILEVPSSEGARWWVSHAAILAPCVPARRPRPAPGGDAGWRPREWGCGHAKECQSLRMAARGMTIDGDGPMSWIAGRSEAAVRGGLAAIAPSLVDREIQLNDRVITDDPEFFQGSAVVGGDYVVKFAWAESPARRIVHEARVLGALGALGATRPRLPVPQLVAASAAPAMLVTRLVSGAPLTNPDLLEPAPRRRLSEDLGSFLAALHRPAVLDQVLAQGVAAMPTECQADTASLRARFPRLVSQREADQVHRFCDFADEALRASAPAVLLHGDLHGFNLVLDPRSGELRLVADFETACVGDAEFDFRYLPGLARSLEFFEEVVAVYEAIRHRRVAVHRVLAWHIRTVLGDALWRSEAGVPLPFGGTPSAWVAELADRFKTLAAR